LYLAFAIGSIAAQYGDDGPVDMIADKTDNVEVVVALDGSPIDDEDDIGNEIMYGEESRGVPLYINNYGKADHGGGRSQVCVNNSHLPTEYFCLLFCPGDKRQAPI